jgi:hypothetical protein
MHEKSGWIVWNFEYKSPYFENDDIALSAKFPQFANVYQVTSTKKDIRAFSNVIVFFMRDVVFHVHTF